MNKITAAQVREVLTYDPDTGLFRWRKVHAKSRVAVGAVAGARGRYTRITISRKLYAAHRLAWLYVTGVWPKEEIDHRNGDKHDNRWLNLREATRQINAQNIRRTSNKNGFMGVHWTARNKKFRASIRLGDKSHFLGLFDRPEDAHAAYVAAKRRLHAGCTL